MYNEENLRNKFKSCNHHITLDRPLPDEVMIAGFKSYKNGQTQSFKFFSAVWPSDMHFCSLFFVLYLTQSEEITSLIAHIQVWWLGRLVLMIGENEELQRGCLYDISASKDFMIHTLWCSVCRTLEGIACFLLSVFTTTCFPRKNSSHTLILHSCSTFQINLVINEATLTICRVESVNRFQVPIAIWAFVTTKSDILCTLSHRKS